MAPIIADYYEKAEFPYELLPDLGALNIGGATIKGYGSAVSSCPICSSSQRCCIWSSNNLVAEYIKSMAADNGSQPPTCAAALLHGRCMQGNF